MIKNDLVNRVTEETGVARIKAARAVETIIETMPDGEKRQRAEWTRKHVPGDTTAQIFWLKNRAPDEWKDCKDLTLAGEIGIADRMKKARERVENAAGKQPTD